MLMQELYEEILEEQSHRNTFSKYLIQTLKDINFTVIHLSNKLLSCVEFREVRVFST